MSIAAAFGWTTAIVRRTPSVSFRLIDNPPAGKGWAALLINFLNGIAGRRHHSHVRKNPWTRFFVG
jgi:hypothetical protein